MATLTFSTEPLAAAFSSVAAPPRTTTMPPAWPAKVLCVTRRPPKVLISTFAPPASATVAALTRMGSPVNPTSSPPTSLPSLEALTSTMSGCLSRTNAARRGATTDATGRSLNDESTSTASTELL